MSLDVYLKGKPCDHCGCSNEDGYWANITHNLGKMAREVQIGEHSLYMYLWRPEEIGVTEAKQLIDPLTKGLKELKSHPEKYEQFNATNGWGMYEHFVPFVAEYLKACIAQPNAEVSVSR